MLPAFLSMTTAAYGSEECGKLADSYNWSVYADHLGSGSRIRSFEKSSGDVEVDMQKADNPPADAAGSGYPYAGVQILLTANHRPLDLSGAEAIVLTYRLSGPVSLQVAQKSIADGSEHRFRLPAAAEYKTLRIQWSAFVQPDWVRRKTAFDPRQVTAIKFQIESTKAARVEIRIRTLVFASKGACKG